MADDRMRNDDLDRNMGGTGPKDQDKYGQQSPGRNKRDDDLSTGQRGAGQHIQPGHIKDEDDFGKSGKSGAGQRNQNR